MSLPTNHQRQTKDYSYEYTFDLDTNLKSKVNVEPLTPGVTTATMRTYTISKPYFAVFAMVTAPHYYYPHSNVHVPFTFAKQGSGEEPKLYKNAYVQLESPAVDTSFTMEVSEPCEESQTCDDFVVLGVCAFEQQLTGTSNDDKQFLLKKYDDYTYTIGVVLPDFCYLPGDSLHLCCSEDGGEQQQATCNKNYLGPKYAAIVKENMKHYGHAKYGLISSFCHLQKHYTVHYEFKRQNQSIVAYKSPPFHIHWSSENEPHAIDSIVEKKLHIHYNSQYGRVVAVPTGSCALFSSEVAPSSFYTKDYIQFPKQYEQVTWHFTDTETGHSWEEHAFVSADVNGIIPETTKCNAYKELNVVLKTKSKEYPTVAQESAVKISAPVTAQANALLECNGGTIVLHSQQSSYNSVRLYLYHDYSYRAYTTTSKVIDTDYDDYGNEKLTYGFSHDNKTGTYTIHKLVNNESSAENSQQQQDQAFKITLLEDNKKELQLKYIQKDNLFKIEGYSADFPVLQTKDIVAHVPL